MTRRAIPSIVGALLLACATAEGAAPGDDPNAALSLEEVLASAEQHYPLLQAAAADGRQYNHCSGFLVGDSHLFYQRGFV